MAERSASPNAPPAPHRARNQRHRIDVRPAPEPPPADLDPSGGEAPSPPRPAPRRAVPVARRPTVHDRTGDAIRRPAQLSDRCAGCGASTRGRAGMVTELVSVGPVRALRVVACSVCPGRHPRSNDS